MHPHDPRRVAVEDVSPDVDAGTYPAKRVAGDDVEVQAAVFADGHNEVSAVVEYRHADDAQWRAAPMAALENDVYTGTFRVERPGEYRFRIVGWIDELATWHHGFERKL